MTNSLLLKMTIEIVDVSIENGGSFHSHVNVYQRVTILKNMNSSMVGGLSHI